MAGDVDYRLLLGEADHRAYDWTVRAVLAENRVNRLQFALAKILDSSNVEDSRIIARDALAAVGVGDTEGSHDKLGALVQFGRMTSGLRR